MTQEYVPKVGDLIELLIQYDSDARETGIITDVNWSYHQWDKKLYIASIKIEWITTSINSNRYSHWRWPFIDAYNIVLLSRPQQVAKS